MTNSSLTLTRQSALFQAVNSDPVSYSMLKRVLLGVFAALCASTSATSMDTSELTSPVSRNLSAEASTLVLGHDLSSVGLMETTNKAAWYTSAGKRSTIEAILGSGGMQAVRLRLWTSGTYDTAYTLALAQRFSKAGYKIYLDMHFSDTWADAGAQATPKSFDASSVRVLSAYVRAYVKKTLVAFNDGGVKIDILSLGNEITGGMMYPTGKIVNNDFTNVAKLWAAARGGVSDAVAVGVTKPKIMIHLDNGWKKDTLTWWFDSLFATGSVAKSDVDVIGVSFYPFYDTGATISALSASLNALATRYGKPLYVSETDWPNSCPGVKLSANYPVSAAGQVQWTKAVRDTVSSVTGGLGAGVFYWEPGFLTTASLGSACSSALLFSVDWSNKAVTRATALASTTLFN